MLNQVIGNVGCNVVGGQYITTSCSTVMHQSIPAATTPPPPPPRGQPTGIGKLSFFPCKCPGEGPKKGTMPHPWDKKQNKCPTPGANKLVNFKECTKLITCVLTICIYTSVNCSFGNLQKTNKENYRVHFR